MNISFSSLLFTDLARSSHSSFCQDCKAFQYLVVLNPRVNTWMIVLIYKNIQILKTNNKRSKSWESP